MKYIILLILIAFELIAVPTKGTILSVNHDNETVTVKIDKIDIGMSGFIVHEISDEHTSILKRAEVIAYDKNTKIAILKLKFFSMFKSSSLPSGKWSVVVGDTLELAVGYSRALLIAPNEEIYHKITKNVEIEWVHPDLFATVLSYRGHPTPLKKDFDAMSIASGIGLLFIYLDKKVYTVDISSFTILSISDASFTQDDVKIPFYSRIDRIAANWFGEGSSRLDEYAPHYYELLVEYNNKNKKLYEIIKNGDKKLHFLLEKFEIGK